MRVIGVGSPFGDDSLAWRVADLLKKNLKLQAYLGNRLEIQISDRPGLALLTAMNDVHYLYLIDALKTQNNQPGQIHRMSGDTISSNDGFLSTHGFGVASALALAQVLQRLPSQVIIYGIEIGTLHCQTSLSAPIEAACRNLSQQIIPELLAKLR